MAALEVALRGRIPPPPSGGPPRTERSPLPCGHLPTPWGVTKFHSTLIEKDRASPHPVGSHPFQGRLIYCLQTPYEIKLPACTRKHLNINITDTGKGNNRRWQAQANSEERANSAGRFRHGCTRKLLSSGKFAGRCGRSPYLFQGRLQCTYNLPKNEQIASRNQG